MTVPVPRRSAGRGRKMEQFRPRRSIRPEMGIGHFALGPEETRPAPQRRTPGLLRRALWCSALDSDPGRPGECVDPVDYSV